MPNLTAPEVLYLQEYLRTSISGVRFLNHCANETGDLQFKQLCQQFVQMKQSEMQQMLPLLHNATPGPEGPGRPVQTGASGMMPGRLQ